MKYPLELREGSLNRITKTTSGYPVKVHYYTDEGLGYFFGFIIGPRDVSQNHATFNIPMVWFGDGAIFWDQDYGYQHLDLTDYNKAMEKSNECV